MYPIWAEYRLKMSFPAAQIVFSSSALNEQTLNICTRTYFAYEVGFYVI